MTLAHNWSLWRRSAPSIIGRGLVYVLRPKQQERAEHISKVHDSGNQDPSGHWVGLVIR